MTEGVAIVDLVRVGFWKSDGFARLVPPVKNKALDVFVGLVGALVEAPLPSVFDHIDHEWEPKERDAVIRYISDERFRGEAQLGDSTCRVCGKHNGSADFHDDRYLWPEGLAHYLKLHGVRPPPAFVRHALRRLASR
jgi:hypothetical protein